MGVGAGLYMCDVVKKSSRSLSHLLMSSCKWDWQENLCQHRRVQRDRIPVSTCLSLGATVQCYSVAWHALCRPLTARIDNRIYLFEFLIFILPWGIHLPVLLECGPMPNLMVALWNIGGAERKFPTIAFLVARRKVWLTHMAGVSCSNAANTGEHKTWTQC